MARISSCTASQPGSDRPRSRTAMSRRTRLDLVILTDPRYVASEASDWYSRQVLQEDGLVASALQQRGLRFARIAWSDEHFDWSGTKAALFRSTWDYFDHFAEFSEWLDRVSRVTELINPAELVRWNCDKHYLRALEQQGIRVPPTLFLEPGTRTTLPALLASTGWREAILKPAVSGAARHTYRVNAGGAAQLDSVFQRLLAEETLLFQRFEETIVSRGEVSLVVIGGRFTHAVRKIARPSDFRVQDDHGGTVHPHTPSASEVALAEQCVAACSPHPFYARVDCIQDDTDRPTLMELELIEPELFFRFYPPAAEALAGVVAEHLRAGGAPTPESTPPAVVIRKSS